MGMIMVNLFPGCLWMEVPHNKHGIVQPARPTPGYMLGRVPQAMPDHQMLLDQGRSRLQDFW
eukprot:1158022-Pelagomonas_calceolata.AAC.2